MHFDLKPNRKVGRVSFELMQESTLLDDAELSSPLCPRFDASQMLTSVSMDTADSNSCDTAAAAPLLNGVQQRPPLPTSRLSEYSLMLDEAPFIDNKEARASFVNLLSGLYCLVLVILAFAFEISSILVHSESRRSYTYQYFYVFLYSMGLAFLLYCHMFLLRTEQPVVVHVFGRRLSVFHTAPPLPKYLPAVERQEVMSLKRKATHSSPGAGSMYLRMGALAFGIVGMIQNSLVLFELAELGSGSVCFSWLTCFTLVLANVFIFAQLYFIFMNSKLTVHRFKNFGRIGFMHLQATNLCIWIRSVVIEEHHVMMEMQESMRHFSHERVHNNQSDVAHHHFYHGLADDHDDEPDQNIMKISKAVESCAMTLTSLGKVLERAQPFMTTCLIEYSIICAATMFILWLNIGYLTEHRIKHRKHNIRVDCGSASKGLFVGLLVLVLTIVLMIVFFVKLSDSDSDFQAIWVSYAWETALYVLLIAACLLASWQMRHLSYRSKTERITLMDDILLMVGVTGQLMFCLFSVVAMKNTWSLLAALWVVDSLTRLTQVLLQTLLILTAQRLVAQQTGGKPGREIITFLLIVNIAMWLINTFETQKASSNSLMLDFYGRGPWMIIVHSTVPLTIFYRFHSSVCLAEIWKNAYKTKADLM